jgi:hypothetical protein
MKSRIKNIKIEDYYQYLPAILIFVVGLVLSFFRWASQEGNIGINGLFV